MIRMAGKRIAESKSLLRNKERSHACPPPRVYRKQLLDWGAHACRVLVIAYRDHELSKKIVSAERRRNAGEGAAGLSNKHATRARSLIRVICEIRGSHPFFLRICCGQCVSCSGASCCTGEDFFKNSASEPLTISESALFFLSRRKGGSSNKERVLRTFGTANWTQFCPGIWARLRRDK